MLKIAVIASAVLVLLISCASAEKKVKLDLYYEALCPDCSVFIKDQLYPTYQKLGSEYLDIGFVPYGNAMTFKMHGKYIVICQHGADECYGNKVEDCVVAGNYSLDSKVTFVHCLETSDNITSDAVGSECSEKAGISWPVIKQCANGPEGLDLLVFYGNLTQQLNPQHQWVPWILFDGHHDVNTENHALKDLMAVVCPLLDNEPEACQAKKSENSGRCYRQFGGNGSPVEVF